MPTDIETLRATLAHCEREVATLTADRDDWEPDLDDRDHTAGYDSMLDECYTMPDILGHLKVSDLLREHDETAYRCGFIDWEDSIRDERERRQTWSDFDELCDAVEEAESGRDDAQEALDEAEADE